jgi:hypothetical protein
MLLAELVEMTELSELLARTKRCSMNLVLCHQMGRDNLPLAREELLRP